MTQFADDNGITGPIVDDNGITLFIDDNGIFLGDGGGTVDIPIPHVHTPHVIHKKSR